MRIISLEFLFCLSKNLKQERRIMTVFTCFFLLTPLIRHTIKKCKGLKMIDSPEGWGRTTARRTEGFSFHLENKLFVSAKGLLPIFQFSFILKNLFNQANQGYRKKVIFMKSSQKCSFLFFSQWENVSSPIKSIFRWRFRTCSSKFNNFL